MKAVLFDKYGELLMCNLAGINENNKAQWVVVTPGSLAVTVKDYYGDMGFDEEPLTLLCDNDEVAPTSTMLRLLGCILENPLDDMEVQMQAAIEKLKAWDVSWQFGKMDLKVLVIKNKPGKRPKGKYFFLMSCDNKNEDCIACADGFEELSELFSTIRIFLQVVRRDTYISLGGVSLKLDGLTAADISEEDKKLFTKIKD